MKKLALIYSNYNPTVDAIRNYLQDVEVSVFAENEVDEKLSGFDLIAGLGVSDEIVDLNSHHSLLPAFSGEEPLKQAFLAGVKVSGITFYYTKDKKIIAQYPLFIKTSAHFDEVLEEMQYLEQSLYPLILEKILKNEAFELSQILKGGCSSCGGCNKCNH